jgi:hypothetical protein
MTADIPARASYDRSKGARKLEGPMFHVKHLAYCSCLIKHLTVHNPLTVLARYFPPDGDGGEVPAPGAGSDFGAGTEGTDSIGAVPG